jgi:hypothetical protein
MLVALVERFSVSYTYMLLWIFVESNILTKEKERS